MAGNRGQEGASRLHVLPAPSFLCMPTHRRRTQHIHGAAGGSDVQPRRASCSCRASSTIPSTPTCCQCSLWCVLAQARSGRRSACSHRVYVCLEWTRALDLIERCDRHMQIYWGLRQIVGFGCFGVHMSTDGDCHVLFHESCASWP
jgi:hypothetical protein